jgi:hypothetical protein
MKTMSTTYQNYITNLVIEIFVYWVRVKALKIHNTTYKNSIAQTEYNKVSI